MKRYTVLLLLFFASVTDAQVASVKLVVHIPQPLADFQHVYVAGTFNNWKAGDDLYQMKKDDSLTYSLLLPVFRGQLYEYKYTIGKWNVVEVDMRKQDIANRVFTSSKKRTRIIDTVKSWADPEKGNADNNPMAARMQVMKDSIVELIKPKLESLVGNLRSLIMNRLQDHPDEAAAKQLTAQMREVFAQIHESIAAMMEKPMMRITPEQKKKLREELAATNKIEDFFQVFLSNMATIIHSNPE